MDMLGVMDMQHIVEEAAELVELEEMAELTLLLAELAGKMT